MACVSTVRHCLWQNFQDWYVKYVEAGHIIKEEEQMYELACVSLDKGKGALPPCVDVGIKPSSVLK